MSRDPHTSPDPEPRPGPPEPDPDATLPMAPPGPEALEAGSLSSDPEDETVEPAAVVPKAAKSSTGASAMVAAGILLSRVMGLVRESVFAAYFGTTAFADVFRAALKMPNFLQNMLGEGTLSASFIPVYSELLHEGRKEDAGRVAGAIFGLLAMVAGALALLGVLGAPLLTTIFLPGFEGERYDLAVHITRILFPMAGVLVLSAWSLGILNSHRSFFLPYFAPVFWNAAMIATLIVFGGRMSLSRLVVALSWGAMIGGALQFLVQLPGVLRVERSLRFSLGRGVPGVRDAVTNAGPAITGRGVVQISAWADTWLASLLSVGALAVFGYASTLYLLPISLFGMSVAAAELPELARQRQGGTEVLRARTSAGLERIAFYIVPSFVGYLALGDVVIATIYQRGEFSRADTLATWVVLLGFTTGLIATTGSRLFSSTFFALRDTKTPARFAVIRVLLSIVLGIVLMLTFEGVKVDKWGLDIPPGPLGHLRVGGQALGVFGLTLGAGIAAWIEWWMLKRALRGRIGHVGAGAG
ncbi:MAG TPA: murein biosynthesis integral membrane protein MurJ, partial [Longimicrobium sp.]|nr:murein biosynthesis integral membrane protein MurJ [Longimicrobium sp.]